MCQRVNVPDKGIQPSPRGVFRVKGDFTHTHCYPFMHVFSQKIVEPLLKICCHLPLSTIFVMLCELYGHLMDYHDSMHEMSEIGKYVLAILLT